MCFGDPCEVYREFVMTTYRLWLCELADNLIIIDSFLTTVPAAPWYNQQNKELDGLSNAARAVQPDSRTACSSPSAIWRK